MEGFLAPGWGAVAQTVIITFCIWWGKRAAKKQTIETGKQVILNTPSPEQVTRVDQKIDAVEEKLLAKIEAVITSQLMDRIAAHEYMDETRKGLTRLAQSKGLACDDQKPDHGQVIQKP